MLAQMPSGESELDPPLDTPVRAATVPKIHATKILVLDLLVAAVVPAFSQPASRLCVHIARVRALSFLHTHGDDCIDS